MTISLNPSPEQQQIVDAMRKALAQRFAPARLRGAQATPPDQPALGLLAELGAFGLGTPEQAGGAGFGLVEEMLLFTELGRHLVTPVALAATVGGRVALAAGRVALAQDLVAGRQPVCLASPLQPLDWSRRDGVQVHLLDWQPGALALLWNAEGIALLSTADAQPQRTAATDRSVTLHRTVLDPAAVARPADTATAARLSAQARLLVAAQLLGMTEATRDLAAGYARLREQFGQPIGAFQAIKHRCADTAILAQVLQAQLAFGALALRDGWSDAAFQVDASCLLAVRHALDNARACIQVHGGIGFTAECDAHLYLLRAHLYEHLVGPAAHLTQRLAGSAARSPACPTFA